MLKETFDSIKSALTERATNPFIGAFCICWLIVNWNIPVLIIKSDIPIEQTIAQIESKSTIYNHLVIPLVVATVILVIYPWITLLVFRYFSFVEIKRRLTKNIADLLILKSKAGLIQAEADLETQKAISLMRIDEHKRRLEQDASDRERSFTSQREKKKIDMEFELIKHRLSQERELMNNYPDLDFPNAMLKIRPDKKSQFDA